MTNSKQIIDIGFGIKLEKGKKPGVSREVSLTDFKIRNTLLKGGKK